VLKISGIFLKIKYWNRCSILEGLTMNTCICGFMANSTKNSWMVSVTYASSYERNCHQNVCIGTFWCFGHGGFVDISSISPRIAQRHQKNTKLSAKQSETGYCCRQLDLGKKSLYIGTLGFFSRVNSRTYKVSITWQYQHERLGWM
jgi:hypothetical protein